MKRLLVPSVALLIAASGVAVAADALKSGLSPGKSVGAFNVKDCTGPNKGKSLCYR